MGRFGARGEHYNAISPKSPHVLWQFGRAQLKEKGEVSSSTPPPTSTNDGDDTIEDFLHFLKVHRKSYPTNRVTGSLNVNSLRNKFETVKYIAVNNLVDMFALCETKLDDSFPLDQFSISNFICHRKDRTSHGGGLIFYVRSDIPQYRRCDIENIVDSLMTGLEIVVLETILNSKEKWLYVLGYKPPSVKSNDMLNAFNILCDKLLNESQNIVILGDYNYDFLKQNDLSNACVSFDLHNIIKGPTCSMTQRRTLLDLCLVTQPERFTKSLNLECWLSDCHNLVLLLNSRCPKHHKMSYGTDLSKSLLTNIIFTIYICYRNIWKFFIAMICPSQCKHLVRHYRKWLIIMRR